MVHSPPQELLGGSSGRHTRTALLTARNAVEVASERVEYGCPGRPGVPAGELDEPCGIVAPEWRPSMVQKPRIPSGSEDLLVLAILPLPRSCLADEHRNT